MNFLDTNKKLNEYAVPFRRKQILNNEINIEMLEEARSTMAKIVKIHGNQYLPAFIRIHNEFAKRKEEFKLKEIALQIASSEVE